MRERVEEASRPGLAGWFRFAGSTEARIHLGSVDDVVVNLGASVIVRWGEATRTKWRLQTDTTFGWLTSTVTHCASVAVAQWGTRQTGGQLFPSPTETQPSNRQVVQGVLRNRPRLTCSRATRSVRHSLLTVKSSRGIWNCGHCGTGRRFSDHGLRHCATSWHPS